VLDVSKLRGSTVVLLLLAAIFVAVRLWNLGTFCLDSDEVWSLTCARAGWSGLFQQAGFDVVHPPLFYMLLKLWIAIGGTGLMWLRLLPALLSFAALAPFYFLCRLVGLGPWKTNLSLALLSLNADQVFHSQYVRMYSLLFLLSLCSYWAFVNYLSNEGARRRALLILAAVNVLLVYSHYYGWTVIACEGLCVLVTERKRFAGFIASAAVVLVCFAPWLIFAGHFALLKGGLKGNIGWIRRPNPWDLFTYYANLTTPFESPYVSAAFLLVCGVLLYFGLRKMHRVWTARDEWRIPLLLTAALLPPLASFVVSQAFPESVWGNRHLVVTIAPFYILVAMSLSFLPFHRMRAVSVILVAAWVVLSVTHLVHPRPRVNYEVLAELMITREPGPERVSLLIPDRFLAFPMTYHLEQHAPGRWDVQTLATLDAASGRHFWIAYHRDRWHGDPPATVLALRGYRVGPGIWVKDDWHRIIAFPVWQADPDISSYTSRHSRGSSVP
jgi:uncharacterized membrane protein